MIDKEHSFNDLRKLFSAFLGIQTELGINIYDKNIPVALRELYQIHDSYTLVKPINTLFYNQDRLLLPAEIKLENNWFDFLIENQSCWKCETEKEQKNPAVYIHDAESIEITGRKQISDSLNCFLTTYALLELTFELDFSLNSNFDIKDLLNSNLKIEELWMNEPYTWGDGNRYSFWLIEDTCLLMDCSITYFATNDKVKFDRISKLVRVN